MGGPGSTMSRRPESANCRARRGLTPRMPAAVERVTAPSGPTVEPTTTPDIPVSEGSVGGVRTLSGVVTEQTLERPRLVEVVSWEFRGLLKKALARVVVVADVLG